MLTVFYHVWWEAIFLLFDRATWIGLLSSMVFIHVDPWTCSVWIRLCCTSLESSPSSSSVWSWWCGGKGSTTIWHMFQVSCPLHLFTSVLEQHEATSTPGCLGSVTAWTWATRSSVVGTSPSRILMLPRSIATSSETTSRWTTQHVHTCMYDANFPY